MAIGLMRPLRAAIMLAAVLSEASAFLPSVGLRRGEIAAGRAFLNRVQHPVLQHSVVQNRVLQRGSWPLPLSAKPEQSLPPFPNNRTMLQLPVMGKHHDGGSPGLGPTREKEAPKGPRPTAKLPAISAPIGSPPLFPGMTRMFRDPTPGQAAAVRIAVAFAAVDDRFQGKPVVAYLRGGEGKEEAVRGVGTLAMVSEWDADDEGNFKAFSLTAMGRVSVPFVRGVPGKALLVADRWEPIFDTPLSASYMHSLEILRPLADECAREHNLRRGLMAALESLALEVEGCDVEKGCNVDVLLALGPQFYSQAMELAAKAGGGGGFSLTPQGRDGGLGMPRAGLAEALQSLSDAAERGAKKTAGMYELWPQPGDEVDGEMRYLKAYSFAAWQAIGEATGEEIEWAFATTDTRMRFDRAKEVMYYHRLQLEKVQGELTRVVEVIRDQASKTEK